MRHLPIRSLMPVVLIAALAGGALFYLNQASAAEAGPLTASGTVEATEVSISPEVSGRVVEVLIEEGDLVAAGDPLFRFDDEALMIKRQQIVAAGASAQAEAELAVITARQGMSNLFDNAVVITAQAELNLANARKALDEALRHRSYQSRGNRASSETITGVEAQLTLADEAVSEAEDAVDRASNLSADDPKRAAAEAALYTARHARDVIQASLNWYTGSPTDFDQAILDAQVSLAQANVTKAETEFARVKIGPDPDDVALAQAQVMAAEAALAAAKAGTTAEIEAIDLQLDKLTVTAPQKGVVLSLNLNAGEVLQLGGTALTLGLLDSLHITVYMPEDRYGQLRLGAQAEVSVDSFPDERFSASITRIASQAEFTPRNVQTEEGRRTTVFAVELAVSDPSGRLKPGMPADVQFLEP
ncbi:MAG TPA: efflux RND transporter periplasmic adaptor subunit [Anaerolineales bacterium]|nr:efflux RND transporter periplasmic adaptor subunit [Anaerolineales bacterium]